EAEADRLITDIDGRCKKMLKTQLAVQKGIKDLHRAIEASADKKPRFVDYQAALNLADRMKQSVKEANTILEIIEKDGTAKAFPEAFEQMRDDMKRVRAQLEKGDFGKATQEDQDDIVVQLQEMIESLNKT